MNELELMRSVCTGIKKDKDGTVRYEVHRTRSDTQDGKQAIQRPPLTEEFLALDRARIAALAYALDGPAQDGGITGEVRIVQKLYSAGGARVERETTIDVIDERVAVRLLNEVRLPRAQELAISKAQLQEEVDRLLLR
ncbi:MAG: hypothetical protein B7Z08_04815 [Sphingomonadales bacterium 32-68-7]|nr:MAG: hypothetical protein B7Z33_08935 [Sphingomonadales bacterium 12-68-11]OYX09556.1 MAG: hypothetical protein B7Z08_04815 [Sphingomonadales bacterium 32-68-7]